MTRAPIEYHDLTPPLNAKTELNGTAMSANGIILQYLEWSILPRWFQDLWQYLWVTALSNMHSIKGIIDEKSLTGTGTDPIRMTILGHIHPRKIHVAATEKEHFIFYPQLYIFGLFPKAT